MLISLLAVIAEFHVSRVTDYTLRKGETFLSLCVCVYVLLPGKIFMDLYYIPKQNSESKIVMSNLVKCLEHLVSDST